MLRAGLASAIAIAACFVLPTTTTAADLYRGGSLKDGYAPVAAAPALAGPCYIRGDVGYSWSGVGSAEYVGNGVDPHVRHSSLDAGALYEAGFGCGSGSRGVRGEVALGYRQSRDFKGDVDIVINNQPIDPPIKAPIETYTAMINGYYDFGNFRGFVPYVGAGVGMASVHIESDPNGIDDRDATVAYQAMFGAKMRIRPHLYARLGYRYVRTADVELAGSQLHMSVNDVTFGVGWQF